jgi:hypothetical protein
MLDKKCSTKNARQKMLDKKCSTKMLDILKFGNFDNKSFDNFAFGNLDFVKKTWQQNNVRDVRKKVNNDSTFYLLLKGAALASPSVSPSPSAIPKNDMNACMKI